MRPSQPSVYLDCSVRSKTKINIPDVEFQARPLLTQFGDDLIIRVPQEDNYAEGFPRQLLEFTIPKSDFSKDFDLNDTQFQKLITMEIKEKTQ